MPSPNVLLRPRATPIAIHSYMAPRCAVVTTVQMNGYFISVRSGGHCGHDYVAVPVGSIFIEKVSLKKGTSDGGRKPPVKLHGGADIC